MSLLLGVAIGWFFGMFIATLFEVDERRRGEEGAFATIARLEREVLRDELLAGGR